MKDRRNFLKQSVGLGLSAAVASKLGSFVVGTTAEAADAPPKDKDKEGRRFPSPELAEAARAAADCIRTGEACQAHCASSLAEGDPMMGKCNLKLEQMLPLCRALLSLASQNSPLAKRLAAICADACRDCAEACKPHSHVECRECHDACVACEKACRAIAKG